jgi:hypothetical protein
MSNKSIAFSFMSGMGNFTLCVFVATDAPYGNHEWALYMDGLRKLVKIPLRTIVLTDGGSPNPVQRKEMADLFKGVAPPTCVVSSSPLVRGMTTALGWFNPNIKSVSPENLKDAFVYLGIPAAQEERVRLEIRRLRAELPNLKGFARPK